MAFPHLSDLRLFLALARTQSLTQTAKVVHLSLSTVSLRLKHLEETVGCRLVVRSPKGLTLTGAGRVFEREAEALLKQHAEMERAMEPFCKNEACELRVAGNFSSSVTCLPLAIERFLVAHPEASVNHLSLDSAEVASAVALGTVDIGVCVWDGPFQGVKFRDLETDRLVFVMRDDHPLAGQGSELDFEATLSHSFVALSDASMQTFVFERGRECGRPIKPRVSASSIEMLLGYVEKGVGIAVLSERTCRVALAHREGLVTRVMRNAWAVRRLRTALPADPLRRSRLSEDFLRILEKVVESDEP